MDTPPLKRNTKRILPAITHYTFLETPVGRLMIAGASEVVMLINFPTGSQALQPRPEWRRDDAMFGDAKRQLTEYFDGTRTDFTMAVAMDGTDFQKGCWTALRQVPFGATVSYGEPRGRRRQSRQSAAHRRALPPGDRFGQFPDRLRRRAGDQIETAGDGKPRRIWRRDARRPVRQRLDLTSRNGR